MCARVVCGALLLLPTVSVVWSSITNLPVSRQNCRQRATSTGKAPRPPIICGRTLHENVVSWACVKSQPRMWSKGRTAVVVDLQDSRSKRPAIKELLPLLCCCTLHRYTALSSFSSLLPEFGPHRQQANGYSPQYTHPVCSDKIGPVRGRLLLQRRGPKPLPGRHLRCLHGLARRRVLRLVPRRQLVRGGNSGSESLRGGILRGGGRGGVQRVSRKEGDRV